MSDEEAIPLLEKLGSDPRFSFPGSGDASKYPIETHPMPQAQDYPDVPAGRVRSILTPGGFDLYCKATKIPIKLQESFSVAKDRRQVQHVFKMELSIPNVYTGTHTAEGQSKQAAKSRAWKAVTAKMHANGSLAKLLRHKTKPEATTAPLEDIGFIRRSETLPTQQRYPQAPTKLFEPRFIQETISGICGKAKVAMQINTDFSALANKPDGSGRRCTLKLDLSGVCEESAWGEGMTKQAAKQAAWLRMTARLHENGVLDDIFPSQEILSGTTDLEGEELKATSLDKQTLAEEKDSKTEIYNYAASLGQVPIFTVSTSESKSRKVSWRRQKVTPATLYKVTVALPDLKIEASAAAKSILLAETAASIDFKTKAEDFKRANNDIRESDMGFGILNTDTASYFFEYLREVRRDIRLETVHETVRAGAATRHSVTISVDGDPVGEPVVLDNKKPAESVAYLVAAVELGKKEPKLMQDFATRLIQDKGKILKPLRSIDLSVDSEALYVMRSALVEARQAGLPDNREGLTAEHVGGDLAKQRRRRRQLSETQINQLHSTLRAQQQAFDADESLHDLHAKKAALPMNQYKAQVIEMVSGNPFGIVVGATGSGKTTQVPQILLEHDIAEAATSVAQRVADERNQPLREQVGYQVRFDAKLPQQGGSINYCTTGILLEQLKHDPDGVLDAASYLIIDEVHERDTNIDFLMIIMKKALAARKSAGKTVPRVVLMSATLDTELFANYFSTEGEDNVRVPCPSLSVPGRTFPVKEKYLGDITHELVQHHKGSLDSVLGLDRLSKEYLRSEAAFSVAHTGRNGAHAGDQDPSNDSVIDWKRKRQTLTGQDAEGEASSEKEDSMVPTALAAATIAHICRTTKDGAILAFFPGIDEILKTQRHLQEHNIFSRDFTDPTRFKICLLHSTIPKEQQSQIFESVPSGCRKIILSTNIAETSVTVTDVKYVVDTGKLRETRYDQTRRITKLQCVWESKSNAKQRAGRAGRVQDGFYYALYSKERHESLRAIGLPELLRTDLQETLLSIKAQSFNEPVETFLMQAIEPPPRHAIVAARDNLTSVEAFTEDEQLTDLGRLLSKLPVHPTLGKMIVLGVIFRCLDPMLVLGAAAEERSLFITPISHDARSTSRDIRRDYGKGGYSDHLASLNAFREIRVLRDQVGVSAAFDRAREKFVHFGAFKTVDQTAKQIVEVLEDTGLIPRTMDGRQQADQYGPAAMNRNSQNPVLIKALLAAGLYPNLGAKTSVKGAAHRTTSEQGVLIHPSSLNDDNKRKEDKKNSYGTLFTYSSLNQNNDGNSLFMRETSMTTPLMAALFGGPLQMSQTNKLEMDGWLPLFVQAGDRRFATKLILEYRKALDRVLNSAYRSLANLNREHGVEFVDDPVRERFAQSVVEVLDQASGRTVEQTFGRARAGHIARYN
ncbi:hypothetical protein LTR78_000733 [Recurvomyces mirabilis]|uniref:RNA helicase n=1 Tax=Recurvomyces mirabilis TaxID=574656 RepID=A0AAE0WVS7_9PEZI|nr:hypothetical protein LTR78_000733 [Recurvomyces mirabilis]KAK5158703.1 hypothetical protein LTS14_002811 [Recurvomyces mirabilis]